MCDWDSTRVSRVQEMRCFSWQSNALRRVISRETTLLFCRIYRINFVSLAKSVVPNQKMRQRFSITHYRKFFVTKKQNSFRFPFVFADESISNLLYIGRLHEDSNATSFASSICHIFICLFVRLIFAKNTNKIRRSTRARPQRKYLSVFIYIFSLKDHSIKFNRICY